MNETYQNDNVHLKILVPSNAAGAIIGKGGEAIAQIQKDSGAKVKMSKANDFYPGTTERVCLIVGTLVSIRQVLHYIMDRVFEKPDPNPKPAGDGRLNMERHKQVKILVPNSTAGMIIGKSGDFIKKIKDKSGAFVQISQKAKEVNLPERCVIIAGELDQNKNAVEMILEKIAEDPQSNTCPQISYADVTVPVASAYPTGSPYATTAGGQSGHGPAVGPGMSPGVHGTAGTAAVSLDSLRCVLRNTGYSDQATEDIASAMCTLSNYGLFNMNSFTGMPHGAPTAGPPQGPAGMISPGSSFSLAAAHQMAPPAIQQELTGTPMDVATVAAAASISGFPHGAGMPIDGDKGPCQTNGTIVKHDIEVPETLVGVIIGVGGTGIVKLQSQTQTNIQISKKGIYAPGTRNRVVTIAGNGPHVMEAAGIIQNQVRNEEARRETISSAKTPIPVYRTVVEGNHGGAAP